MSRFSCAVGSLLLSIMAVVVAGCGGDSGPNATADYSPAESGAPRTDAAPASDFSASPAFAASSGAAASRSYADVEAAPVERARETESVKAAEETSFAPNNGRQSGVLTAGSFDDVEQFADYLEFLCRNPHQVQQCQLPLPPSTQQTIISVTDTDGKPLGNVRCVVKQAAAGQTERVLLDRTTASDGRNSLEEMADAAGRWEVAPPHYCRSAIGQDPTRCRGTDRGRAKLPPEDEVR